MTRRLAILLAALVLSACDYSAKDRLSDAQAEAAAVGPDIDNADNLAEDVNASMDAASNMAMIGDGAGNELAPAGASAALDPKGPSFRCGGLLSRVEDMVCSNPELATRDREAADQFTKAMKQGTPDQQTRLRAIERQFLTDRNHCADPECVSQAYQWYLDDIDGLMGWPATS